MADAKISQLTVATALAGSEVVPVVQGSTTKKATIDQILAPAAGKGIDFSANTNAPGMTSELLDWYEEGVWTPEIAFATNGDLAVTYDLRSGTYTRIGRQVTVSFILTTTAFTHTTASGVLRITGLPFNAGNTFQHTAAVTLLQGVTKANYTCFGFYANAGSKDLTSSASGSGKGWDNITAANMPTGGTVYIGCTLTYFV